MNIYHQKRHDVTRFARSDPEHLLRCPNAKEPDGTTTGKCGKKRANGALGREHRDELQTLVLSTSGSEWGRNENCNPISVQR